MAAVQVDFLVAGLVDVSGNTLSNGKVTFFETDGTTLRTIWLDAAQLTPSTNPVILETNGTKEIFAEGTYSLKFQDENDVVIATPQSFFFQSSEQNQDVIRAADFGSTLDDATITLAIASASGNDRTVYLTPGSWAINNNLTVPSNINYRYEMGASTTVAAGITQTINGVVQSPLQQIFKGTGTTTLDERNNDIPSVWATGVHDNRTFNGIVTVEDNIVIEGKSSAIPLTVSKNQDSVSVELVRYDRTSASPADNDNYIKKYFAENDNDIQAEYVRETYTQLDVSDGTEKGRKTVSCADGVDGSIDPVTDTDVDGFDLLVGSHKMGGNEIIDSSRNADFVSLDIDGTAVITSSRNAVNQTLTTTVLDSTTASITASITQTQGQGALTSRVNEVSVCANDDDTNTLPPAVASLPITYINNGANIAQLFPISGDDLGNGTDIPMKIIPGDFVTLRSFDSTTWIQVKTPTPTGQRGELTNIGCTLTAGVFAISGSNGASLSTSNPAFVKMPSKANPGRTVTISVTTAQDFIDDTGASEIINNLFGASTGIAWANDIPFYIYAVLNDAETAVAFMISRIPHLTTSPVVGEIGAPDDAVADNSFSFFSFENIDETLFDSNPCIVIGSIRMQMTASDDWTVQTLGNGDGIGTFQEGVVFTMPVEQNGAASQTFFKDNGGTAPRFNNNEYEYQVSKLGMVTIRISLESDGGQDGVGAVIAQVAVPLISFNGVPNAGFESAFMNSLTGGFRLAFAQVTKNTTTISFLESDGTNVENGDFGAGARQVLLSNCYCAGIA